VVNLLDQRPVFMSPGALADRGKLTLLAARRLASRVVGWPVRFLRIPALPGRNDRLVIAPQDVRTADPTRAAEIYASRFAFAGKVVISDGRSPFEMLSPSDEWAEALHGFGWLRHLRAAESAITRANARSLVDEWINLQGSLSPPAWHPEVVTRRLISWLSQATLILDDSDVRFYRRFLKSLARQVRYLRSTAGDTRDGVPRLQARIALAFAALCISGQIRYLNKATRQLAYELERQILPDGGHASRNPGALVELLLDLLPLSQAYAARNVAPPPALLNAIDRMMPMLRFFRHTDGTFALFNGMGPTQPDLLATLIACDDARGAPVSNAVHSGYQRVEAGNTVMLMDTGRPPPFEMSMHAHAGCLALELSHKGQRIVVNCGLPGISKDDWREHARTTAAHSTVTLNDTSSCRFAAAGAGRRTNGVPIVSGPTQVPVERETIEEGEIVRSTHDGYAGRFSVVHQRSVILAPDGNRLDGEDMFLPAKGDEIPEKVPDEFAVRFHLHPAIRASRIADGHGVMLILPNKDVWNFHAYDDMAEIEDGVFLGGSEGARRTFQIVVRGHARAVPNVRWTLSHTPPQTSTRRSRDNEPELPLDLG
jgi:uncharacterized heparinase superfamily protein